MKLFNTADKLARQKDLFQILKEEILDIDLKGSTVEFTNFKIAELAERLADKGVRVESGAQAGDHAGSPLRYNTECGKRFK